MAKAPAYPFSFKDELDKLIDAAIRTKRCDIEDIIDDLQTTATELIESKNE